MPKHTLTTLTTLLLFLSYFISPANANKAKNQQEQTSAERNAAIKAAIHLSTNYLVKQIKPNGQFIYRLNMNPAIKLNEKYNILRHAGAIYALSNDYSLKQSDPSLLAAIKQSARYLQNEAIEPLKDEENLLAIWSKPEINNRSSLLQAKLGGTGLGLVALLSVEKLEPGFTPISDLRALGQFIIYMQKENGSFYSKYIPSKGGRNDKWTSLYYPGEAALGLLMLYEKDPSEKWLKAATKTLEFLAITRENSQQIPADHWALLATEKLFSISEADNIQIPQKRLIRHAVQICEAMLNQQIYGASLPEYNGGFTKDGRTTPTATRLEGLLATLSFLPQSHPLHQPIHLAVEQGVDFLLNAQIKQGDFIGAIPRAIKEVSGGEPSRVKKFNRRSSEVRIDYVQHALSAWVQYLSLRNHHLLP